MTTEYKDIDYFNDPATRVDPYDYYEYMAVNAPVWIEPVYGAAVVTGYEEALAVLRDPATFSSLTIVAGPNPALPRAGQGRG